MWAPQDKEAHIHEKKIEKDKERDICVDIEIILCIQLWMFCRVVCEQSYLFPFMVILSLGA